MLRSAISLMGNAIIAKDGEIGHCSDIYFDDVHLGGQYLVVDTGNWLPGRKVLLPTRNAGQASQDAIAVDMTREQIKNSPDIDTDSPVSRRHEQTIFTYYHWPIYWEGAAYSAPAPIAPIVPPDYEKEERPEDETHLRSCHEVTGYRVDTATDPIGHIEDFIFDIDNWQMPFLVIDTANWLPGSRKVLIIPEHLTGINWSSHRVSVDLTKKQIQTAPEFDPGAPVNDVLIERVVDFYGHLQS